MTKIIGHQCPNVIIIFVGDIFVFRASRWDSVNFSLGVSIYAGGKWAFRWFFFRGNLGHAWYIHSYSIFNYFIKRIFIVLKCQKIPCVMSLLDRLICVNRTLAKVVIFYWIDILTVVIRQCHSIGTGFNLHYKGGTIQSSLTPPVWNKS